MMSPSARRTSQRKDLSDEQILFVTKALQELGLSLHEHATAPDVALEMVYASMGLFGCWEAVLYCAGKSESDLWIPLAACCSTACPPLALSASACERLGRLRRPYEVERLLSEDRALGAEGPLLPLFESFSGGMLVPVAAGDRFEGMLLLGPSQTACGWDSQVKHWLQTIGQQGALALKSARARREFEHLSEDRDRKVLQLLTLFEAGREIHSFANWDLLTKNLLYTAMGYLGIREGGLLAQRRSGGPFHVWHSRSLRPARIVETFRLPPEDPLLVDLNRNRRAISRREIEESFGKHEILLLAFEVIVPGLSSRGVEFLLVLGSKLNQSAFSEDEIEYLSILCGQAAVVSENRELVRQNIRAERLAAIGQALAGLGHDFRGVLNGLSGASRHLAKMVAQISEGQSVDGDRLRRWWSVIRANEKRLADLVEDIVEYSKPRVPVREPCQINAMIQDMVHQRQEDLVARRIHVCLDLASSLPTVKADETRMFRVFSNLFDNACDAVTPKTGKVEIRTRLRPDAVIVEVRDNGIGIESENLPKLFDPLFTTKKGSKGTGFGLANVKKIIEEHGGHVRVSSRPSRGSAFTIEIPLRESSRLLEAAVRQDVSGEDR